MPTRIVNLVVREVMLQYNLQLVLKSLSGNLVLSEVGLATVAHKVSLQNPQVLLICIKT